MDAPRYVLIANPGSKRCELYRHELGAFWANRGTAPDITVVPWEDVVARDGNLDHLPGIDQPAIVRMESPGKNEHVRRLLWEAGSRDDPTEPPRDWQAMALPKGLLLRPGLLYRGFRRVLHGLRQSLEARRHLTPTACPLAIAEMFDKSATCTALDVAGVPTPGRLDAVEMGRDVARFFSSLGPVTYVKLNTGSSAVGILALYRRAAGELLGVTTLAVIDGQYYSSRRLSRLSGDSILHTARFILSEGAIVQRGIALAQVEGENFDVRVVCVYGRPSAVVVRISPHPMTNLHLGGRRGDLDHCRATVPTRHWLDALDHCIDAAACFTSAIAGVDLVFERGSYRPYILEVNAFGDFFPGWTDAAGRSIHCLEIEATARRNGFLD